ncbi:MAG TPA: GIY-YIG nuclease family protein [Candidatus Thorarchaeota archaeon]|nr:MAG: GIY-YIG nuclease family protein [Candidatus Thorarchaeota archaeon]RLI58832.1 MAG: GIY-YIG nuclease family protein [Candidatus Thorarchaeota archaeon]HDD67526.1 GIY-YIG nuclease family protein [Candidatus Thorarchaeota archaeon]
MRGVYVLLLEVDRALTARVGSGREMLFEPGMWVYVGSAMGRGSTSLEKRVMRHLKGARSLHWHIDYLLAAGAKAKCALTAESMERLECRLAQTIGARPEFKPGPRGFGASDCTSGCTSHIFKYDGENNMEAVLSAIMRELGLEPLRVRLDHPENRQC